jgi:hypothetical protein
MLEHSPPAARALLASVTAAGLTLTLTLANDARAAGPFVDAPLTLPPLKFSADAGIGFGTFQPYTSDPNNPSAAPVAEGSRVGWGTSLEAAVGLPFVGELGLRVGARFGSDGVAAGTGLGADHFARLFDPIVTEPGGDSFANPEAHLRGTLFDLKVLELGLETRFVLPTANGAVFAMTPGIPLRVHVPGFLRVDTGIWVPIAFASSVGYTVEVPAQAFFQVGDAFFGPVTGVRYNVPNQPGADNTVDVPVGLAAGYSFFGGRLDLKAQLRTERINDAAWASQYLGGGLGAGLRLP